MGALVATRDPNTGHTEYQRVLRTFPHLAGQTITATFADVKTGHVAVTLTATPQHPFFVVGRGAVPLGQLGIGTQIVTRAGPPLVITKLVKHDYPHGIPVYNFEVQSDHTYFVGSTGGGMWVHNICWTRGRFRKSVQNVFKHWQKHRAEFPHLNNAVEYYKEATEFFANPPADASIGIRSTGDAVIYQPSTENFGVVRADGTPSTYYRPNPAVHGLPTNMDYFNQEASR